MERAARRPMLAAAALTTAGALALSPITVTPPDLHTAGISPLRVSTQEVQLTDAWFDLLNDTLISAYLLGQLAVGANPAYPLPNPMFIAPILTQLVVVNPLTYAVQLLTGEGAKVPTEIIAHINNLVLVAQAIGKDVPPAIVKEIQNPFFALQQAVESITTASNLLIGLLEAPAVFLNGALNGQYGLIGYNGPIALGFIIRNVVAQQLFTPPPAVLPFKKAASASALRPKASAITVAPSGTAGSARSKPKAPSSAASSKRKPAASAKTGTDTGQGHSKRG
ncbi:hypothetical protein EV580_1794 [Mycobacterium sp. BK086]|uniref:hypothetical protein n=1 Tax=Mycobacterium sp. BK086 TaxID=2512165 RepID=UPI0010DB2CD8|nr:hypothetical protein [Mycobacterium sp. BK086]TDO18607.1 hypothetical protein EV580_1794 [Mycobacterium sp. BK086]